MNYQFTNLLPQYMEKICVNYAPHRNKEGLNHTQIKILMIIGMNQSLPLTELSSHAMIDKGAISRIITKLVKEDIVKKENRSAGMRTTMISLTPMGLILFEQNKIKLEEHINHLFKGLNDEEQSEFQKAIDILEKYIERIE